MEKCKVKRESLYRSLIPTNCMDSKLWFEEAQAKLKDSEASLSSKRFSATCFWAQQAAELALKAVYMKQKILPSKSYSEEDAKNALKKAKEVLEWSKFQLL